MKKKLTPPEARLRAHVERLAASLSSDYAHAWFKVLMARSAIVACAAVLAAGCLGGAFPKPKAPSPAPAPVLIEGRDSEFVQTCTDVFVDELGRDRARPWGPGDTGREDCLNRCRRGETKEQLVAWLHASPERADYLARLERAKAAPPAGPHRPAPAPPATPPSLRGRLAADGLRIVDARGVEFVEPFVAELILLTLDQVEIAARLDEVVAAGGKGVRTFGGHIEWADGTRQTTSRALEMLPFLVYATRERGLYLIVDAITDSRAGGYDVEAHLTAVSDILAGKWPIAAHQAMRVRLGDLRGITSNTEYGVQAGTYVAADHTLLAVANEPWHPSQSDRVQDMDALCQMARRVLADFPNLWLLGAGPIDRPVNGRYAGDCGPVWAAHIDRGGSPAEQLARVAGLAQIARATGKPGISLEPIGAAEATDPGKRLANPAFFGDLGQHQASYGIVGVFHSSDGLYARPLGPVQLESLRAFVAGYARPQLSLTVPTPGPCTTSTDPEQIVRCQRSTWGRMSEHAIATYLREIARDLNAAGVPGGPFGVLVKDGGTNCGGYSCDVICSGNGPGQIQYDVLGDVEGAQSPGWSRIPRIVERPCEVVDRAAGGPPFPEGSAGRWPPAAPVGTRGGARLR